MQPYFLIPLLPLLAAVILALAGRRLGETSHRVGITAVSLSFALSVAAFVDVLMRGPRSIPLYRLLHAGGLTVDLGLYLDPLAVSLLLLVTGVSAIVHVYSSRYMIGDPRYSRFFAVMGLFTAAMVLLVMSRNLLMMYMCWEAMGICSYLLISHWAHRHAAGRAATKAFLVNAVADVGLGLGVILTFYTFGTLDIPQILERAAALHGKTTNLLAWAGFDASVPTTTLIVLLLFLGAMGKSAQFPLHVWLPFAMEAPTPVSALIHAATMVNAGPFLLVRFSPLLLLAPSAMSVIAAVGATTALFAALVSLTQTDIKKILAYSTISQIGFMIMTCGLGAFVAAVYHLLAHGFFKGFLFLSTGNALLGVSRHHRPQGASSHAGAPAAARSLVGVLIYSCIPPLIFFSGPYEAMWTARSGPAARLTFWIIALSTVFFTAMYLTRGIVSLSREALAVPGPAVRPQWFGFPHGLLVVAAAALLGVSLFGFSNWFSAFLAPSLPLPGAAPSPLRLVWPFLAAAAGWGLACSLYAQSRRVSLAETALAKRLYMLFWNKLYIDEIYHACLIRPTLRLARALQDQVEARVIERMLTLLASSSLGTARWLLRAVEGSALDRVVQAGAAASVHLAQWLWRVLEGRGFQAGVERLGRQAGAVGRLFQHGEVHTLQDHLLLIVGGLASLIGLFYLFVFGGSV